MRCLVHKRRYVARWTRTPCALPWRWRDGGGGATTVVRQYIGLRKHLQVIYVSIYSNEQQFSQAKATLVPCGYWSQHSWSIRDILIMAGGCHSLLRLWAKSLYKTHKNRENMINIGIAFR